MFSQINKMAGFSLIEIMVVVALLSILAVFGMGAYDGFRAEARRGEAKKNLSFLAKLQATYQMRKAGFWDGSVGGSCSNPATVAQAGSAACVNSANDWDHDGVSTTAKITGVWTADGSKAMNTKATAYGYRGQTNGSFCERNALGFKVNNCEDLRYGYWIQGADTGNYVAVAYAPSDEARWLFPRCTGKDGVKFTPRHAGCNDAAAVSQGGNKVKNYAPASSDYDGGDAWCTGPKGNQINFVDIIAACE